MQNNDLSDNAAIAECRRLLLVVSAQRRVHDDWFGHENAGPIEIEENSAFCMGMLALFRYARGQNVPASLVQSFRDDLLKILFCGLASNTMAIPSYRRMSDRPWAHALRLAEMRLAFSGTETIDWNRLAHLLDVKLTDLLSQFPDLEVSAEDVVPPEVFRVLTPNCTIE